MFPKQKPTAERLDQSSIIDLKAVGLSNAKANYFKNIAAYAQNNNLAVHYFDTLNDRQIIDELTQIKGVGEWTAQIILIFSLNRPDVFPVGDLAIQQGINGLYNLPLDGKDLRKKLVEISKNWIPYRTLGTRYVWLYVYKAKNSTTRY